VTPQTHLGNPDGKENDTYGLGVAFVFPATWRPNSSSATVAMRWYCEDWFRETPSGRKVPSGDFSGRLPEPLAGPD